MPRLSVEALQAQLDALALQTPTAANTRPEELMDQRILDEIERSGFVDQLYR